MAQLSRFYRDTSNTVPVGDLGRERMVKPCLGRVESARRFKPAQEAGTTLTYALEQPPAADAPTAITGTPDSLLTTTPRLVRAGFPRIVFELAIPLFSAPVLHLIHLSDSEYNPLGILGICTLVQTVSDFPSAAQCDPRRIQARRSSFWRLPAKPGCGGPPTPDPVSNRLFADSHGAERVVARTVSVAEATFP